MDTWWRLVYFTIVCTASSLTLMCSLPRQTDSNEWQLLLTLAVSTSNFESSKTISSQRRGTKKILCLGNLQVSSNLQVVRRDTRMIHHDAIQEGQNAIHIVYTFSILSVIGDSQSKGATGAARAVHAGIKSHMPVFTKDKLSSKYRMIELNKGM